MILDKRIKSQGFSEEEHDFIIGTHIHVTSTIMVQHIPHEGIEISKSCFFLDFCAK